MNFLNNMIGVVAPVTTGYIVGATGSFVGAFLAAGIVLVIGIVAYVFILGPLEPIAESAGCVMRTVGFGLLIQSQYGYAGSRPAVEPILGN